MSTPVPDSIPEPVDEPSGGSNSEPAASEFAVVGEPAPASGPEAVVSTPVATPVVVEKPVAIAEPFHAKAPLPVQARPAVAVPDAGQVRELEDRSPASTRTTRLVSLDALRGFDMFWIIGGEEVVRALNRVFHKPWSGVAWHQMNHSDWVGFRFYDLIFPMFVFIVGVSTVFSLGKTLATQSKWAALRRVIFRGVFLYLIGVIFYGGVSHHFGDLYVKERQLVPPVPAGAFMAVIADVRFLGVLQRIAICYLVTGLLFIFFRPKVLAGIAVGLLVVYWGLMTFVRAPGQEHVSFDEGKNLANWIDARYLPGFKWDGDHDPEGLLSTLPAIAGCMLGLFAGMLLADPRRGKYQKFGTLFLAGAIAIGVGYAWGFQFPVIKKLWTSSFVLVTAGCGAVVLSLFYLVIDVWRFRIWARPFVWIGMNAIALYLVWNIFPLDRVATRIVGGPHAELANHVPVQYTELASPILALVLILLLARFLYKRQIFLRV